MGMRINENNCRAAVEIMKVLADNKCTVADVTGIFNYVEAKIRNATTVPELDHQAILEELISHCD